MLWSAAAVQLDSTPSPGILHSFVSPGICTLSKQRGAFVVVFHPRTSNAIYLLTRPAVECTARGVESLDISKIVAKGF